MSESNIPPTSIACGPDDMGFTEQGQLNLALSENAYNAGLISELSQVIEAANEMCQAIQLATYTDVKDESQWWFRNPRVFRAMREYQRLRDLYWR